MGQIGISRSATVRNNAASGQAGRQLDADARDVLDHARSDLDQALSDRRELALASGLVFGIAARTPCISQNAAVWRTSRT